MTVDVSLIVPMALDAKTRAGALMEFSKLEFVVSHQETTKS